MYDNIYRAYHKKYGMIYPDEYFTLEDAVNEDLTFFGSPAKDYDTRDFIFMQFSGVQDKNKRDIYEGDILQETFMNQVLEYSLWQVIREHGSFGVRPLVSTKEDLTFRTFHQGVEESFSTDRYLVSGNIYENMDMVTGSTFVQ